MGKKTYFLACGRILVSLCATGWNGLEVGASRSEEEEQEQTRQPERPGGTRGVWDEGLIPWEWRMAGEEIAKVGQARRLVKLEDWW